MLNKSSIFIVIQILLYAVGILVCIALGLVFVIITPVVACCFCCCRLCGRCGGKLFQKPNPHACCRVVAFSIIVAILAVLLA